MDGVGLLARQFFLTRRTIEDGIGRLKWREMWQKVRAFHLPVRLPVVICHTVVAAWGSWG
jgi:hypothetical protein